MCVCVCARVCVRACVRVFFLIHTSDKFVTYWFFGTLNTGIQSVIGSITVSIDVETGKFITRDLKKNMKK